MLHISQKSSHLLSDTRLVYVPILQRYSTVSIIILFVFALCTEAIIENPTYEVPIFFRRFQHKIRSIWMSFKQTLIFCKLIQFRSEATFSQSRENTVTPHSQQPDPITSLKISLVFEETLQYLWFLHFILIFLFSYPYFFLQHR